MKVKKASNNFQFVFTRFLYLGFALMLFMGDLLAQPKMGLKNNTFYPFAVWYSGGKARATMLSEITPDSKRTWKQDLEHIKGLGFNTVKTWVEWAHCEPKEGDFHFENLQLLLELAKEVGINVFIQVYGESAPEWVGKKFPDALFEAQNGYRIKSQVDPGYCVDNIGVRQAMMKFYEEAAKVAIKFPNFLGWDLWSEPHIVQWGKPDWIDNASYCYCPASQKLFRNWLKKKYGTIGNLNKAWYRTFPAWADVEAPRFGTILSYTDFIDWREYNADKMAIDLKMRYDAIRKIDSTHIISSHASPVSLFSSPYGSAENDFMMSKQVNYYGLSQYPKHNLPGDWKPWLFMTAADFSYSANKSNGGYYVGELQAGYGTVGLNVGDPVTPEDQRIWVWSSLATGAKGIFTYAYYPMSSGYESGGYGLINLDGTMTKRAVALGKIASFISDHSKLFLESKPVKPQIALVYNPLSQMVGGERRTTSTDGQMSSLVGYYRFFKDHNVPVDFIFLNDLSSQDLSQYKLIILPYSLMFTQKAATLLENYVEKGGNILGESRLAWLNSRGYASNEIPGMGFSKVFGVRESKVKTIKDRPVSMIISNESKVLPSSLMVGDTLRGSYFAESLELSGNNSTKVIAKLRDGSPCITFSKFGKGSAIYIGSFLFLNNTNGSLWDQSTKDFLVRDSINQNNNEFLLSLLDLSGIELPVTSSIPNIPNNPIVLRLHQNSQGYLLYVLNQGTETQKDFNIKVRVAKDGLYQLTELLSNRTIEVKSDNNALAFKTFNLSGKDAEIWELKLIR